MFLIKEAAGTECENEHTWPDLDAGLVCGKCKVLVRNLIDLIFYFFLLQGPCEEYEYKIPNLLFLLQCRRTRLHGRLGRKEWKLCSEVNGRLPPQLWKLHL